MKSEVLQKHKVKWIFFKFLCLFLRILTINKNIDEVFFSGCYNFQQEEG